MRNTGLVPFSVFLFVLDLFFDVLYSIAENSDPLYICTQAH